MDVCADPAPPPVPDADDPAEEAAFFRALIRRVAVVAAELIDDIYGTDQLTLDKKAGSVDRLGRLVTRNALAARQLRQPLRTAPSPRPPPANPAPRRGATPPVDNRPLSKLKDAELAARKREQEARRDPLAPPEPVEDFSKLDILELLERASRPPNPDPSAERRPTQPGPARPPGQAPEPPPPATDHRPPITGHPSPPAPPSPGPAPHPGKSPTGGQHPLRGPHPDTS